MRSALRLGGRFRAWCHDKNGRLKWVDTAPNLVVDEGIDLALDLLFNLDTPIDWFVGLTGTTPVPDHADTITGVHAGWVEEDGYSEIVRQAFTPVRSGENVNNAAAKAVFTSGGAITVGGAFLAEDDTPGGVAGRLLCVAPFTGGDKVLALGDLLTVQYDFGGADDGI